MIIDETLYYNDILDLIRNRHIQLKLTKAGHSHRVTLAKDNQILYVDSKTIMKVNKYCFIRDMMDENVYKTLAVQDELAVKKMIAELFVSYIKDSSILLLSLDNKILCIAYSNKAYIYIWNSSTNRIERYEKSENIELSETFVDLFEKIGIISPIAIADSMIELDNIDEKTILELCDMGNSEIEYFKEQETLVNLLACITPELEKSVLADMLEINPNAISLLSEITKYDEVIKNNSIATFNKILDVTVINPNKPCPEIYQYGIDYLNQIYTVYSKYITPVIKKFA